MTAQSVRSGKTATPHKPFDGIFEDLRTTPRRHLFSFWGVQVEATPYAWLAYAAMLPSGLGFAYLFQQNAPALEMLFYTAYYALLLWLSLWIHSLGHILSGKLAGSAMDKLLLTATRQVNIYDGDQEQYPARVHITRALGGPLLNIVVGLLCLLAMAIWGLRPELFLIGLSNLAGIMGFLPFETVDGGTIRHYLRREV